MSENSRTQKSLKNSQVAFFYYIIQLILGFVSRKIMLDALGSELLGLNTTISNLLSLMNLAELGIGTTVAYFLYEPLFRKDTATINEIVTVQGWLYRRVAYLIIGLSGVVMCFFPWIFEKSQIPLGYAYMTYIAFLFGSMLGYFVNYRQIVLDANQETYKVTRIVQGVGVVKTILQMIYVSFAPYPYIGWIVMEVLFCGSAAFILNHVLKKEYPWLKPDLSNGKPLLSRHPEILKKTKQVFVHKIGTIALHQTTPLLLYTYSSLTMVAYYDNYMIVLLKLNIILNMIFSSLGAAVGNLIASKDRERILRVFWELFDALFLISSVLLLAFYFLMPSFVSVWLAPQYILPNKIVLVILATCFINMTRSIVDSYISGYGLFHDVWAPLTEALINVVCSIVLGYFWGIIGVLMGTLISLILTIQIWKPYFLFTQGFHLSPCIYFQRFGVRTLMVGVFFGVFYILQKYLPFDSIHNFMEWVLWAAIYTLILSICVGSVFYVFSQGVRDFVYRVRMNVLKK